jgi:hypothetical protein
MSRDPKSASLEEQIDRWRSYLRHRQAIHSVDVAELEDHLREQVAVLVDAGLATDEAFLVAVKRMGNLDALSREFAREHSERLWKQLVVVPYDSGEPRARARTDAIVVFSLAVAAAVLIKVPALFGIQLDQEAGFYARNLSLFVLPLLSGYFVWKRRLDIKTLRWLAVAFVAAGVFANVYPFAPGGYTEALTALHLPIALWLVVGIAYAGGRWGEVAGRMDFIRFSGELFIYFVLIALGGGVLIAFTAGTFKAIGIDPETFIGQWLVPCGAAAGAIVAGWLVEAKQSVVENIAPVLTRLFTPLFTAVLLSFLVAVVWTANGIDVEREALILFDLLLVVVLGLLLYSISAREPVAPPGLFDTLQLALVVSALAIDVLVLVEITGRITEFGTTPNKAAALGENVILLANLAWSAWLLLSLVRRRTPFATLERWQTGYLPVYAAWAWIVVLVFPPVFGYA